ncbi:MAG: chalcone isomerase family protein [Burkholderiales bacterium]|nr:chalcone isomerase family protein [Burkholderiales bacterium]
MRRRAVLAMLAVTLGSLAMAAPELTGLSLRGQGRMRYFGLSIYDIRLWSAAPVSAERWADLPLTLEIEYARSLDGGEIAKRSLKEMRRQADISDAQAAAWLAEMQAAFPDVKAGDRISGSHEPGVAAQFFVNGQPRRRVADATFARLFFGIWLSPQTSEPALRQQLLGGHAGR